MFFLVSAKLDLNRNKWGKKEQKNYNKNKLSAINQAAAKLVCYDFGVACLQRL